MEDDSQITETQLMDKLDAVNRRLDSIQKQLDLLFADREILETIQGRITGLEEQVKLSRIHDNEVRKDLKEEIGISGDKVKAAVETQIGKIGGLVESKKLIPTQKGFWRRLFRR